MNNGLYFTSTEASLKHRILAFKNDSFCSALILCINRRNALVGNKPWFLQDAGRTEAQQPFSSSTASGQENLLQNQDASSEAPPIISRLESLRAHARLGAGVQTGRGGTSRQAPATDSPPATVHGVSSLHLPPSPHPSFSSLSCFPGPLILSDPWFPKPRHPSSPSSGPSARQPRAREKSHAQTAESNWRSSSPRATKYHPYTFLWHTAHPTQQKASLPPHSQTSLLLVH